MGAAGVFAAGLAGTLAVLARSLATGLAALAAHHVVAAVGAAARATAFPGSLAVFAGSLAALAANRRGIRHGNGSVAGSTGHGVLDVFKEAAHHVVAASVAAGSLAVTARSTTSILTRVHLILRLTKINALAFAKS